MHEIEEMVRIILKPGPQRGRDVVRWVHDASKFKRAKIYEVATDMVVAGELRRGLWALAPDKSLDHSGVDDLSQLYVSLASAIFRQREAA